MTFQLVATEKLVFSLIFQLAFGFGLLVGQIAKKICLVNSFLSQLKNWLLNKNNKLLHLAFLVAFDLLTHFFFNKQPIVNTCKHNYHFFSNLPNISINNWFLQLVKKPIKTANISSWSDQQTKKANFIGLFH